MSRIPRLTDKIEIADEVAKQKQVKTTLKGKLTRQKNYIAPIVANPEAADLFDVGVRLEILDGLHETFSETVDFLIEHAKDDTEIETFESELGVFEDDFFRVKADFKRIIQKNQSRDTKENVLVLKSESGNPLNFGSHSKLPEIKLPKFDGKIENWLHFKELFDSIILKSDQQLGAAQKIQYLLASIPEEVKRSFEAIQYSDEGFNVIWNELNERFDNKLVLIDRLISEFFKQKIVQKDSAEDLRKLIDTFTANLNQLKLIGQAVDKWDMIIINLVKHRMDDDLKRIWDRKALELRKRSIRNHDANDGLPTWAQMKEFLQDQCQILEQNQFKRGQRTFKPTESKNHASHNHSKSFHSSQESNYIIKCCVCKGEHRTFQCPELEALQTPQKKFSRINELRLCHNCLKSGHSKSECKSPKSCFHCGAKHHSIICFKSHKSDQVERTPIEKPVEKPIVVTNHSSFNALTKQVFLSTAIVNIEDKFGNLHKCRALLDSGSQSCLISKRFANEIQFKKATVDINVVGLNQNPVSVTTAVQTKFSSRVDNYHQAVQLLVVPEITDIIPHQKIYVDPKITVPGDIADRLADPFFNIPSRIDIIIGAEFFYELLSEKSYTVSQSDMKLKDSRLGWIVTGTAQTQLVQTVQCKFSTANVLSQLQKEVKRFLDIETFDSEERILTEEETECEALFERTTYRNQDGRFVVTLPTKPSIKNLGSNESNALKRFLYMERKLSQDVEKQSMYHDFLNEYEALGHMEEDKGPKNQGETAYFLPHHAVVKPDSTTTQLRVVFDASSKSETGLSLNDVLQNGPVIQEDLIAHLLRSKKHKILIAGDLEKWYRQVLIHPDQKRLQKIKFKRNSTEEVIDMSLLTVTYGTASAQYLTAKCLQLLARTNKQAFPEAAGIIEENFSVDDLLCGGNCDELVKQNLHDVIEILSSAKIKLRKLVSNCPEILSEIADADKATVGPESLIKTLGVVWNPTKDTLSIKLKEFEIEAKVTKRTVLSEIVTIFNPTGEFNPVVVKAKIFLQRVFELKIDWDTVLPEDMQHEWKAFRLEVSKLTRIEIPRFVLAENFKEVELHGFCDASEKAYGAAIYLRSFDGIHFKSALLFAKSRVAPLQKQSLARLELCAAELLAKIYQRVERVMKIQFIKQTFWSDSTIALSWIATAPNRLHTYVANRVSKIQSKTQAGDWKHIKGSMNPADILSRGCSPSELAESNIWWKGPSFLERPESEWPAESWKLVTDLPEIKPINSAILHSLNEQNFIDTNVLKRNSIRPLQRLIAFCLRFINNCKSKIHRRKGQVDNINPVYGPLKVSELQIALKTLVRHFQQREFHNDYHNLKEEREIDSKSRLKCLTPFFDKKDRIIRVGGRLKNSDYSFAFKHQILLPDCHFTTSLLQDLHKEGLHVGQKSLLSIVRHQFWPLKARDKIRHICRSCVKCFKVNPSGINQFMGQLPKDRFAFIHPFLVTGVDCAGPILIKSGTTRSAPSQKSFIVLFICLATKAIHLELVTAMSTEAFLASVDRFFSIRGFSNKIYSDNGTNFVGAAREFRELQELIKTENHQIQVQKHCANNFVEWKFIPPRAPQFGGIWESAVKLAKYHIVRVLGESLLTFEEFYTVLKKVEAMLNSRPLTPETDDPTDLRVLTPGHFLVGRPLISKPEEDIADISAHRLTRWRRLQSFSQQLWKRLSNEYVHQLQQKPKNFKRKFEVKVGDMVLVKDESSAVLHWNLARVIKLHPGNDGITRVVDIKTANGELRRPLTKIAPLPIQSNDNTSFSPPEDVEIEKNETN